MVPNSTQQHGTLVVFSGGVAIGTLGGFIGLGGAEFRLPLLIGLGEREEKSRSKKG